ncbi:MAG TPA: DUF6603 domain-containing protein [Thermoanaerobaculia bacterium]|jgi:hypothetical protein|nr:DUF6603 domain-containing protein [Thermoanaerobaculia bacterium]
MSTNGIEVLAQEVAAVFTPLRHLDSPAQITAFFHDLGYELPGNQLFGQLPVLVQLADQLISSVEDLAAASSDQQRLQAAARLLEAIARIAAKVHDSLDDIKASVAAIPNFIGDSDIDELPLRLVDYLLSLYLWRSRRRVYGVLLFAGLLDEIDMPADAAKFQPAFRLRKIWWERLPQYLSEPQNLPEIVYQWDSNFQSDLFLERLYVLFNSFLLPGGLYTQSAGVKSALQNTTNDLRELRMPIFQKAIWPSTRSEFGINITPVEQRAADKPGFAIIPYIFGDTSFDFDISEKFEILFEASASVDAGIGVVFRPGGIRFLDNLFSAPLDSVNAGLSLEVRQKESTGEILLIGEPGASRLAIEGPHGLVFVSKAQELDAGFETGFEALRLVIAGGDGDGFINEILGDGGITAEAGIGIRVSRREGLTFTGSGGLEIRLPAHIELGPIEILGLLIALKLRDGNVVIEAGADFKVELGPLVAVVENIGISGTLSFPDDGGNLGPANLAVGFKPPNGVGLSLDAGIVKGGGYLYFDFDKGEYAGALELTVADFLSLTAIGLINTTLPGGEPGFSLLIIVTAEFNPGFQLGFGFAVTGVGGLLGLNRAVLLDPLVLGVRTGAANSILFPTNVVANAPRILSDLRAIFPPEEGTFLIGPMAKIGWGTPTLISLSLGIIIEIPGNVVILGRLRLALPTDEEAVLVLQISFVGALEFDKSRFWFFATLFESRVLFITLEGEMGLLMDFSDNPNFVLSVGGFHPRYTPPPLPFPSPARLALSLINESFARVRVELYFALTSNSVQMGCRVDAFFGFDAFSVEGYFGFDALLRFSPFYFIVEISVGFSVKVFGLGLWGVHLRAALEGPTPWHISGSAEIEFLFFTFDVDVDVTFGERRAETLPPIEVLPKLRAEFEKLDSWRATLPASGGHFVSLRDLGSSGLLVLHPVGTLEITQRFVPLNLTLDKVGNQKPSDVKRASVAVHAGALEVKGSTREKFAAAQYREMNDAQKLSAPAYEPFDSGITLGAAGEPWASGTAAQRNVRYESIIIDTAFQRLRTSFFKYWDGLFAHFRGGAAVARSTVSLAAEKRLQPFADKIAITEQQFTVALQADNSPYAAAATFGSFAEAEAHLAEVVHLDPALSETIHVIPNSELKIA